VKKERDDEKKRYEDEQVKSYKFFVVLNIYVSPFIKKDIS